MATATKKRLTNPHLELITASNIVNKVSSQILLEDYIHDDMKCNIRLTCQCESFEKKPCTKNEKAFTL